jgi:Na+/phosphate symporter
MKYVFAAILAASLSASAMDNKTQAEQPTGKDKLGKSGLIGDVLSTVAGPVVSSAAQALEKEATAALRGYEEMVIARITAACAQANKEQLEQIKKLEEKVDRLQKTVDEQNNRCTIL